MAPVLIRDLESSDPGTRRFALRRLHSLRKHQWRSSLSVTLPDPHPELRMTPILFHERYRLPDFRPYYIRALADPDPGVRKQAALIEWKVEDPDAVPGLVALLADGDPAVRKQAEETLRRMHGAAVTALVWAAGEGVTRFPRGAGRRSPAGMEAARARLGPRWTEARLEAIRILTEMRYGFAAPALLAACADPHPRIRAAAERGAREVAAFASPYECRRALEDPDPAVRRLARRMLDLRGHEARRR